MRRRRLFGWRLRRDEGGAILVMAVPGVLLALVATALSVDIGRQVLEKRTDQSVADAAALDAARNPANAQALAEASARRNGFDPAAAGHTIVAQRGTVDANKVFTAAATGSAVLVTVSSHMDYIFAPGDKTLTARAAATMGGGKVAGFSIGTNLASVDTSKSPLLDAVLGQMMGGSGVSADVVSWKGLVSSHVSLEALRQELELLDAGVQFGTVDQMLAADLTLAKLATATANVLSKQGNTSAALLFTEAGGIIAKATSTGVFQLGDMISVAAGSGDAALATDFNVFGLVTGGAALANGTNTVSVPNIGITIPGAGNVALSLKVVEGLQTYIGPDQTVNPGPHKSTSQVELTLTPTLNLPISVAGLDGTTVTGSLPVIMTTAGADATLTSITCPNPNGGERVTVDLKPVGITASGPLTVSASVLTYPITFNTTTTGTGAVTPPPTFLDFTYPGDFYAVNPTAAAKRVGASPLGLGTLTTLTTTATLGPLPLIPPLLTGTVNGILDTATPLVGPAVSAALGPVLTSLDTLVVKPLLDTLGISIGAADVTALGNLTSTCAIPAHPRLVN
ncbi:MAG: pilus assembly protein TadG-related protein [Acidimicrobiales bacterium]